MTQKNIIFHSVKFEGLKSRSSNNASKLPQNCVGVSIVARLDDFLPSWATVNFYSLDRYMEFGLLLP